LQLFMETLCGLGGWRMVRLCLRCRLFCGRLRVFLCLGLDDLDPTPLYTQISASSLMQFVIFIMVIPTSKLMVRSNPTLILEFIAIIHLIRVILGIC